MVRGETCSCGIGLSVMPGGPATIEQRAVHTCGVQAPLPNFLPQLWQAVPHKVGGCPCVALCLADRAAPVQEAIDQLTLDTCTQQPTRWHTGQISIGHRRCHQSQAQMLPQAPGNTRCD